MSIVSFSALKNSIFNLISKFVLLVRVYFHVKMIFYFLTNGLIIEVFTHVDKQSLFFVPSCGRAKSLQSCLTLCDRMDCSPAGFSVHGILQARNTGVGCHFLLQGSLPDPGIKSSSPALQADAPLSHQGSLPSSVPGRAS